MDWILLAGIVRVSLWAAGTIIAYRQKRGVFLLAFGLATTTSAVFAASNAGADVPAILFDYAVLVSTPIAALLVMGLLEYKGRQDEWRWW